MMDKNDQKSYDNLHALKWWEIDLNPYFYPFFW